MKLAKYFAAGLISIMSLASCGEDFMDVEYTANLDQESAGIAAANNPSVFLNGLWSWMVSYQSSHDDFGVASVMLATDMMGEDIGMAASSWFVYDYDFDNREYNYRRTSSTWKIFYTMIAKSNEIISLYPEATNSSVKALLGQALAIRGYSYLWLVQLYQNPFNADGTIATSKPAVPLMLTVADTKTDGTNYTTEELEELKGRNTVGLIMDQIGSDLSRAAQYLEESGYKRESGDKNNVDYQVANGILARYYMVTSQWSKAAEAANKARQGYSMTGSLGIGGMKDVSSADWMWGFNHDTETQTTYASYYSHISNEAPGYSGIVYSTKIIDARLYSQIPSSDKRKQWFNGPSGDSSAAQAGGKYAYAARKFGHYSDWTEDYVYMRAPEMVLIEAEAYARQGQNDKAAQTLAVLMDTRIDGWSEINTTVTVDDILLQRRIELWGEGFVRTDLLRNNKGVDRTYEGSNHLAGHLIKVEPQDKLWVYQIPNAEMQENKHITDDEQND